MSQNPSITIVAASKGYPGIYETKKEIKNIPKVMIKMSTFFMQGLQKLMEKFLRTVAEF